MAFFKYVTFAFTSPNDGMIAIRYFWHTKLRERKSKQEEKKRVLKNVNDGVKTGFDF